MIFRVVLLQKFQISMTGFGLRFHGSLMEVQLLQFERTKLPSYKLTPSNLSDEIGQSP